MREFDNIIRGEPVSSFKLDRDDHAEVQFGMKINRIVGQETFPFMNAGIIYSLNPERKPLKYFEPKPQKAS